MKCLPLMCATALFGFTELALAQGFVNLDFESANIPNGTSSGSLIPISDGLPGWSAGFVRPGGGPTNGTSQVAYDGISLGGVWVSIVDANVESRFSPIQGNYSAFLFGGETGVGSLFYGAQINQTGLVPDGTKSIQLDAAQFFSGPNFVVMLGGQTINMSPLQTFPGYTLYGGNIPSSLAGEVANLSITEPPPPIGGIPPSGLELDDIAFSPQVVPEPGAFAVFALGAMSLGFWRWRKSA